MIVMTGICVMCDDGKEKRLAKRKPPLCGYHYSEEQRRKSVEKNKDKPKKIAKPLNRTAITRKKEPTGELEVFEKIWRDRPHESFINKEPLYQFNVSYFAHVLSKAENRFPKFKLYPKAIRMLTLEQHHKWDKTPRSALRLLPEWDKMFELEAELIAEYKLL